jgi:hypothetical protein
LVHDVWPEAEVSGFVAYGYLGLVTLQDATDRAGKGEFVDFYLDAMRAAETSAGYRLVHYLDLHYYSEAQGGGERVITEGTSSALVQARVQAPRSLWDRAYIEDSWIPPYIGNRAVELLPWLKTKIQARYPGTKLAISEWNFGGGTHISGAVAAADALGIFGRDGVHVAAFQGLTNDAPFVLGAFRAYRNYDGQGAAFGDRSLPATSSDDSLASVYASIRSADATEMVLIAINRSADEVEATLAIASPTEYETADVFAITSASPTPAAAGTLTATSANQFSYTMPGYSVSVIVPSP